MSIKTWMTDLEDLRSLVNSHDKESSMLAVYVIPKSGTSDVGDIDPWRKSLKVRLTSEPISGKANRELQSTFSKLLNLSLDDVIITSGLRSRRKTIRLQITQESLISKLEQNLILNNEIKQK